jgi:hypothetical protein
VKDTATRILRKSKTKEITQNENIFDDPNNRSPTTNTKSKLFSHSNELLKL